MSERSKKIVYQKGINPMSVSRLEAIDPRIKELSYEIEEIVRDIGTNIIEDESFFGHEVIHEDLILD